MFVEILLVGERVQKVSAAPSNAACCALELFGCLFFVGSLYLLPLSVVLCASIVGLVWLFGSGGPRSSLQDCRIGVTLEERAYLFDGREGELEQSVTLNGTAIGGFHVVDDDTVLLVSNSSREHQCGLKISVEAFSDDFASSTTLYEGIEYEYSCPGFPVTAAIYDESRHQILVPASRYEITDGADMDVVGRKGGIIGIDVESGETEFSFLPAGDDRTHPDNSSRSYHPRVQPFAIDADQMFFYAGQGRFIELGVVDLETGQVIWMGTAEGLTEMESGFDDYPGYAITSELGAIFSYGDRLFAISRDGDIVWEEPMPFANWGRARIPAMVSDADGDIYTVLDEETETLGVLSETGEIVDRYEFDDRWARVRPLAVGADESLWLEGRQQDCDGDIDDADDCELSAHLLVVR